MKNIITLFICLAGILLGSCTDEDRRYGLDGGGFDLTFSVINHDTETQTKASVPAEEDEEKLSSLYLLFFEYSENSSGKYITFYKVTGELSMNSSISIPFTNQTELKNGEAYSILAVANIDKAEYISESPETWITGTMSGKTEAQAIASVMVYIQGAGIDESDDTHAIKPSELIMSGRTTKTAEGKEVALELTRGLVRFDVQNLCKGRFDLVSVSIWNAPISAPVWSGEKYDIPSKINRYYGVKRDRNEDGTELTDIKGGLYCFENFVSAPKADDKATTCLIIGLAPKRDQLTTEENEKFDKEITYHRINVHPEDAGQNTKRNYVYKVSINSVRGQGEGNEYDAWSKGTNNLNLIINNWNLDDNGMVLTDGKNTLVIPVKRVILDPAGDEREYSIYTLGDGDPYISKTELPQGISVTLTGNRLIVVASSMPVGEEERKGMIEIALGGLRGEINFIQSENVDEFLSLNMTQLSSFPALGISSIPDGYLEVNSSGDWTARIYNNSADTHNPGFAFNILSAGGVPQLELSTDANFGSNHVQIYTTGANPGNEPRYAFVIFSLKDNPEINRSLALIQKGSPDLKVIPDISSFSFLPNGNPSEAIKPYFDGEWVVFTVDPGINDEVELTLNAWSAQLDNENFIMEYFNTDNEPKDKSKQIVKVKSKGNNLTGNTLSDILRIAYMDNSAEVSIRINQSAIGMSLTQLDSDEFPVTGGESSNGIRVNAPEEFTYNIQIVSKTELANASIQGGYLIGENGEKIFNETKVSGRSISEVIKVGFPKLLTPNVNVTPEMTVRVAIDGFEDNDDMIAYFTVKQKPLTPKSVQALNTNHGERGYIRADGSSNYNRNYNRTLTLNTTIFGPGSPYIYLPNSFTIQYGSWGRSSADVIPSSVTHVNAHYVQDLSTTTAGTMFNWLKTNEGILVINDDHTSSSAFNSGRLLNLLGYTEGTRGSGLRINTAAANTKVYQYIFNNGPFGAVNVSNITNWSYDTTRRLIKDYPASAIPIIVDNTSGAAQVVIDPVNRVIFNGELQIFENGVYSFTGAPTNDYHRFLANYIAFIHNVSMYGSHFTDHFLDNTNTQPPYDYKK